MVSLLIMIVLGYWLAPFFFIIRGLTMLKSEPEKAKKILIFSALMLLVGVGFCGALLN